MFRFIAFGLLRYTYACINKSHLSEHHQDIKRDSITIVWPQIKVMFRTFDWRIANNNTTNVFLVTWTEWGA